MILLRPPLPSVNGRNSKVQVPNQQLKPRICHHLLSTAAVRGVQGRRCRSVNAQAFQWLQVRECGHFACFMMSGRSTVMAKDVCLPM